jgi:hypothetical protein
MKEFYGIAIFFTCGLMSLFAILGALPEYILQAIFNLRYFAFGPCYRKFATQPLRPPSLEEIETILLKRRGIIAKRRSWRNATFLLIRRKMVLFGHEIELPPLGSSPRMLLLSREAEGKQTLTLECRHPICWPVALVAMLIGVVFAWAVNNYRMSPNFLLIGIVFEGILILLSLYKARQIADEVWAVIENAGGQEKTGAPAEDKGLLDIGEFYRRRKRLNLAFTLIIFMVIGIIFVFAWQEGKPIHATAINYGNLPSAEVFQMVMGRPIPEGITGLEIAGHGFNRGERVWMRFQENDADLQRLISPAKRISRAEAEGWINFGYFRHPEEKLDAGREMTRRDAFKVHWQEIMKARTLAFYQLEKGRGISTWDTVIGFDQEGKEVYVHAGR